MSYRQLYNTGVSENLARHPILLGKGPVQKANCEEKGSANPGPAEPDMECLYKQCTSRSVGFFRNQLILICTVFRKICEFVSTTWIHGSGSKQFSNANFMRRQSEFGKVQNWTHMK